MADEIQVAEEEVEINPLEEEAPVEAIGEIEAEGDTPTQEVDPLINQEAVQEKINKITADKYKERQRADDLERQLAELKVVTPALPSEAPTLESCGFDEDKLQAAMVQHEVTKQLKVQTQQHTQQEAELKRQNVANEFTSKEAEFAATHPDYGDAVKTLPQFKPDTLDVIYSLGPEVSHYLGKHLDVADAVANATLGMAAVKLGQIATELKVKTKVVKPSNAPTPVKTLNGGGAITKSMEDMSMDEIMAL